uniref:Gnk2-homologous domain-containing protein n=1 Tax=Oryza glumipatula TaxID=40148 RepID=A0A0D9YAF0_9ORYZ
MAALLLLLLLALLCLCGGAAGDPRTAVAGQECAPGGAVSGPALAANFVPAMDDLNSNVSANGFGTSAVGTTAGLNPNAVFGLGQCYRDLSPVDCKLCFAEVRSLLPKCYPRAGGRLYLDGCFGRYANYSFFSETLGPDDAVTCGVVGGGGAGGGNYTGANPRGFADAVRAALANVTGVAASAAVPGGGDGRKPCRAIWLADNGDACPVTGEPWGWLCGASQHLRIMTVFEQLPFPISPYFEPPVFCRLAVATSPSAGVV